MRRILIALVATSVSVMPGTEVQAEWIKKEVCTPISYGGWDCHIQRVWVPDDGRGGPSPETPGFTAPREPSWFDQNCRGRPGVREPVVTEDGTVLREWVFACRGVANGIHIWIPDSEPGAPPAPDPEQLARILWDEMLVQLPRPSTHVAPTDTESHGYAFVQTPTVFWVDDFQPITRTLTLGPTWVTLTATPIRVDVDLGNGDTISCATTPEFPAGGDVTQFDGCTYTYRHSSAMSPNGETWPVTVTAVWTSSWTSSSGAGGNFGETQMQAPTRQLPVAEIQAIVTDVG